MTMYHEVAMALANYFTVATFVVGIDKNHSYHKIHVLLYLNTYSFTQKPN